jgi:nicotinate-nucleotide adenylyltransferase
MSSIFCFFGSFNPIHIGHLSQIKTLLELRENIKIEIIISPHNPHKNKKDLLPFDVRKEIMEISINGYFDKKDLKSININTIEESLPKPNYTYITLRELTKQFGKKPYLLLGTDVINNLDSWKNSDEIKNYPIVECIRGTDNPTNKYPNIRSLNDISSTYIRNNFYSDKAKNNMVKEAYIYLNRYYELKKI